MEEKRENTLTVTIARNSDGEILRVIQCRSIFAGVGGKFEDEADSCAFALNEGANGMETLAAANAVECAIKALEKKDKDFAIVRKIFKAAETANLTKQKEIATEGLLDEESEEE